MKKEIKSDKFLEDSNIRVSKKTSFDGQSIQAGAVITFVSKRSLYNGKEMGIPPPEFEALMFDHALNMAKESHLIKKRVSVVKSDFDNNSEIKIDNINRQLFFEFCQKSIAARSFCIAGIESWTNKSLVIMSRRNNINRLIWKNKKGVFKNVNIENISNDKSLHLSVKVFQLIPQVFMSKSLNDNSGLKNFIKGLIEDRNSILHMGVELTYKEEKQTRADFAHRLFQTSDIRAVKSTLGYLDFIYKNSKEAKPEWLVELLAEIDKFKNS